MTSLNLVIQTPQPLQLIVQPPAEIKLTLIVGQGPSGPPGKTALVGGISSDTGNSLTSGNDGGLYVPNDITADPLAYYILSKDLS